MLWIENGTFRPNHGSSNGMAPNIAKSPRKSKVPRAVPVLLAVGRTCFSLSKRAKFARDFGRFVWQPLGRGGLLLRDLSWLPRCPGISRASLRRASRTRSRRNPSSARAGRLSFASGPTGGWRWASLDMLVCWGAGICLQAGFQPASSHRQRRSIPRRGRLKGQPAARIGSPTTNIVLAGWRRDAPGVPRR